MPATEMLKATEAAVVARVSLRDVNRVIDERILPETLVSVENGRFVLGAACTLIAFYFESAKRLTSEERLFAIRSAEPRLRRWNRAATEAMLKADWTASSQCSFNTAPHRTKAHRPLRKSWRQRAGSAALRLHLPCIRQPPWANYLWDLKVPMILAVLPPRFSAWMRK